MKKFLKTLVVGLCLFTLLCCALPAAFAADKTSGSKKEENVYAIGMDAQGGICSTVVTYTNLSGKLESTPEQPTMTGYTFDGWYTEPVGGSKVTTSTVFTSDATIYAHWTAKAGTYYLRETTTPKDYSACPDTTIVISATHDVDHVSLSGNLNNKIINKKAGGITLPSTGGIGTTLFYVVGSGLMVAAIVLLVTKKRMENK